MITARVTSSSTPISGSRPPDMRAQVDEFVDHVFRSPAFKA